MLEMFELKLVGEIIIIAVGVWLTFKNKSKSTQLKELEEKNKRLRIEVVLQEEKIEGLKEELSHQMEVYESVAVKQSRALERAEKTQSRIKSIRTEGIKRSKTATFRIASGKNKAILDSEE